MPSEKRLTNAFCVFQPRFWPISAVFILVIGCVVWCQTNVCVAPACRVHRRGARSPDREDLRGREVYVDSDGRRDPKPLQSTLRVAADFAAFCWRSFPLRIRCAQRLGAANAAGAATRARRARCQRERAYCAPAACASAPPGCVRMWCTCAPLAHLSCYDTTLVTVDLVRQQHSPWN